MGPVEMNKLLILALAFIGILEFSVTEDIKCSELPKVKPQVRCCDFPDLDLHDKFQPCLTETEDKATSLTSGNISQGMALAECLFTKNEFIKDRVISTKAIKKVIEPLLLVSPEWSTVLNAAIDKCVAEGTAKEAELKAKMSTEPYNIKDINPLYAYITSCSSVQMMINCPTKHTPEDPSCIELRNYFTKCSEQFPPPYMKS